MRTTKPQDKIILWVYENGQPVVEGFNSAEEAEKRFNTFIEIRKEAAGNKKPVFLNKTFPAIRFYDEQWVEAHLLPINRYRKGTCR